jgi:DNA repair protein RadC
MNYLSESSQAFISAPNKQCTIKHVLTTTDKHLRDPGTAFSSARRIRDLLRLKMTGSTQEEFMVFYINQQNRLIGYETLSTGIMSSTKVYQREVVKRALYFNTASIIVARTYSSGEITPGYADKTLIQHLVNILQLVDIRVQDYLIIGDGQIFSFAEHCLL